MELCFKCYAELEEDEIYFHKKHGEFYCQWCYAVYKEEE